MPKQQSEKKRQELQQLVQKQFTNPREKKPHENYLDHVRDMNLKSMKERGSNSREQRKRAL